MVKEFKIKTDCYIIILWFFIAAFKILFNNILYFRDVEVIQFIITILFWLIGLVIILRRFLNHAIKLDTLLIVCSVLICLSILNANLLTFVFAVLVWSSISYLLDRRAFIFFYSASLFFLIITILISVALNEQVFYIDGRYGKVPTFGFENSNSFPQLLVIYLLISTSRLRTSIILGNIILFFAYMELKTRSMYMIIILYPLVILLLKFFKGKIICILPLVLIVLNFVMVLNLNNEYIKSLDVLLSYRLSYSLELINNLSFSQWFTGTSSELGIPMDMSYINLVYKYGIIATAMIVVLAMKALHVALSHSDSKVVAIIVCFFCYAFVENVLLNYYLNPTLYFIFYFYAKNKQREWLNNNAG